MIGKLKTPIGRLRVVGFIEGSSYLLLLGIAMPLKYIAGIPEAVKIIGWVHGLFFIFFLAAALQVHLIVRWPFLRVLGVLAASVIPFGTFILDKYLRREEQKLRQEQLQVAS